MNIETFLGEVACGDWHLDNEGCLSSHDNEDCPIWYVYRQFEVYADDDEDDPENYIDAGVRIGLRKKTASRIAAAADNRGEPKLRRMLLKAAGITEQSVQES